MKVLLSIVAVAAALTLGGVATEQWLGNNRVEAQGSSACFQNCANVRRWPPAQCREFCARKGKRR